MGENLRKSLDGFRKEKLDHNQERRRCWEVAQGIEKFCSWKKTDEKKIEKFRDEYELFNSLKNFSKAMNI